ncbi:MAG: extracellular solute-binding protein [Treponema sp.]|nr:extracellular solute-binding protein [Treponema sp.]
MVKLSACLAALALMGNALYAGGSQGSVAKPGQLTEITYIVWDRGTVPPGQGTIDDNWWTRYVNEQVASLGVKIKYVPIPQSQESQMMSTMLAANNAPDLAKTSDIPLLKTYISGGGITDITALVDRFGPNIKALLGDSVLQDIKYDGKIYFLPHLQNGITGTATWIRRDWLDAVGMDVPSTAEEFYQVLKVIKEKDPGKVGSALVPFGMIGQNFSGWDGLILPGFVKDPPAPERFLVPFPMWPETKEALRWMNKLYAEGLLTDQFIIDRDQSMFRQKIARGEMFAFQAAGHYPYHSAYGSLYDKLRDVNPNARLESIDTFRQSKTAERIAYWARIPTYQYRWFIPFSSKNAELVVKVYNWMSSEAGYMVGGMGTEGEDYKIANGVPTVIDEKAYLSRVPWIEPQYGLASKPYSKPQDKELFLTNYIKDFNPAYHNQIKKEAVFLSDVKYFPPTISVPTPVSDKLTPVVSSFWSDTIAKIVIAPQANFDRIFDDAVREYRALGGDEIAAEAQRLYR